MINKISIYNQKLLSHSYFPLRFHFDYHYHRGYNQLIADVELDDEEIENFDVDIAGSNEYAVVGVDVEVTFEADELNFAFDIVAVDVDENFGNS